ncbi:T9SS type A sorting domain-containing protein [Cesiribacter sp. SM1]|uniref:T9SS type A sorting domain-containing protein n=1 Tax=Cesiribacter sp. SM1 TaxID=2861196 RepID=UPI001CD5B77A|nr:T9SS type A sorting domain-containing protein [Cesiribacter sp. SM1]
MAANPAAAQSIKFIVTDANDDSNARDANPGDGVCEDGAGRCTLRAAIDEANASDGLDVTIVIPGFLPGGNSGNYTLSRVAPNDADNTYENNNNYGDLDVNGSFSSLLLQGTGTPGPTISISPNDRILDLVSGSPVTIERIHFTGGTARAGKNGNADNSGPNGIDGQDGEDGGALRIGSGLTVDMDQVTFSSNFTQSGGNGAAPASSIDLIDGGNGGSGGNGGAVFIGQDADVTINRATISGNGTGDGGSPATGQSDGAPADGGRGGNAGNGAAIYNAGTLRLTNSTITDNLGGDPTSGAAGVNGGERGEDGEGGSGGGIAHARYIDGEEVTEGSSTIKNNIIAGNSAGDDTENGKQPGTDFYDNKGGKTFTSEGYNLVGTKNASGAFRLKEGDEIVKGDVGINPRLNSLNQNDDEAVPTRSLQADSPALNAGTNTTDNNFDARGFIRPQGEQADKGAYEANSERMQASLEITDFNVGVTEENLVDNDIEFVEITNTGNYPVQMDDHVVVGFGPDDISCISINLYGELQPGETFKIGDPALKSIDHQIQLDYVGGCGDGNNQFSDQEGSLAVYEGGTSSIGTGFEIGNYEAVRKDLLRYTNSLAGSRTKPLADKQAAAGSFTAYPNPLSQDGLWLEFPAMEQKEVVRAYISDLSGRILAAKAFTVEKSGSRHHWNMEHGEWSGGMYLLIIKGEQTNLRFKLMK